MFLNWFLEHIIETRKNLKILFRFQERAEKNLLESCTIGWIKKDFFLKINFHYSTNNVLLWAKNTAEIILLWNDIFHCRIAVKILIFFAKNAEKLTNPHPTLVDYLSKHYCLFNFKSCEINKKTRSDGWMNVLYCRRYPKCREK